MRASAPTSEYEASWLCPTPLDRARLLEMGEMLDSNHQLVPQLLPLTTILAAFWVGPWALLPILAGPLFGVASKLMPRMRKPEYLLLTALLVFITTMAVSVSRTGGTHSPLIFWVIFYMVGVAARFGRRALAFLTVYGVLASVGAVLAATDGRLGAQLPALLTLIAVGLCSGRYTRLLTRSEFDHREAARLDRLTGLLNRAALESRIVELREQAAEHGGVLSLVMCDLDHFKAVNDRLGHRRGDAVLRDAAAALRSDSRSFELIYRIGGEEFVVVLPGVEPADARTVAERLRESIERSRPGGLDITASFGVAAARGDAIDFEALLAEADRAHYEAKAAGRNRVRPQVFGAPHGDERRVA